MTQQTETAFIGVYCRKPILLRAVIQGPAIAPRYSTARTPELPHSFGGTFEQKPMPPGTGRYRVTRVFHRPVM
jgi:hypothetical protein